jgi:coniferyl-aldehyde dehydrogenase
MEIMKEEIFGPLLPVIPYDTLDEAIAFVNARPRPLALYYFDTNRGRIDKVLSATHSGGVCVNDVAMHVGQEDLPFGGIGASGMGAYHGHEGFLTFSHAKSVFHQRRVRFTHLFNPPYGKAIDAILKVLVG